MSLQNHTCLPKKKFSLFLDNANSICNSGRGIVKDYSDFILISTQDTCLFYRDTNSLSSPLLIQPDIPTSPPTDSHYDPENNLFILATITDVYIFNINLNVNEFVQLLVTFPVSAIHYKKPSSASDLLIDKFVFHFPFIAFASGSNINFCRLIQNKSSFSLYPFKTVTLSDEETQTYCLDLFTSNINPNPHSTDPSSFLLDYPYIYSIASDGTFLAFNFQGTVISDTKLCYKPSNIYTVHPNLSYFIYSKTSSTFDITAVQLLNRIHSLSEIDTPENLPYLNDTENPFPQLDDWYIIGITHCDTYLFLASEFAIHILHRFSKELVHTINIDNIGLISYLPTFNSTIYFDTSSQTFKTIPNTFSDPQFDFKLPYEVVSI